mmetsp:Transcript_78890/g.154271  ORF Transcript_78890/g.154271 Transcript_78890/m.154271 type:complete len:411 (+) Transcript_78890:132-1364(+)
MKSYRNILFSLLATSARAFIPVSHRICRYATESYNLATIAETTDASETSASTELAEAVDQLDPKKTSGLMLGSSSSLARRTAVEALSNALLRSLDRTSEATAMIGDELVSVGVILDNEVEGEVERLASVEKLVSMLQGVIEGKDEIVQRETILLTKIQELKQQVVEKIITERLDEAAVAKAELISIELVLSETMVACKTQLEAELAEAQSRMATLRGARADLPRDAADTDAVRAYGYQGIIDLQDILVKTQRSSKESADQVATLQRKIKAAMQQRNVLLGAQSKQQLEQEEAVQQEAARVLAAAKKASEEAAAVAAAAAAASQKVGTAAGAASRTTSSISNGGNGMNEVELIQQSAAKTGAALAGLGKALFKTAKGEEGVGDILRASKEDVSAAARSITSAGSKILGGNK